MRVTSDQAPDALPAASLEILLKSLFSLSELHSFLWARHAKVAQGTRFATLDEAAFDSAQAFVRRGQCDDAFFVALRDLRADRWKAIAPVALLFDVELPPPTAVVRVSSLPRSRPRLFAATTAGSSLLVLLAVLVWTLPQTQLVSTIVLSALAAAVPWLGWAVVVTPRGTWFLASLRRLTAPRVAVANLVLGIASAVAVAGSRTVRIHPAGAPIRICAFDSDFTCATELAVAPAGGEVHRRVWTLGRAVACQSGEGISWLELSQNGVAVLVPSGTMVRCTPNGDPHETDGCPGSMALVDVEGDAAVCLDRTEVTQAAFADFEKEVIDARCPGDESGLCTERTHRDTQPKIAERYKSSRLERQAQEDQCNRTRAEFGAHPATCVNWHQASAYCSWKQKRLPTRVEWLAAVGDARFPWGEGEPAPSVVNACGESCVATERAAYNGKERESIYTPDDPWPTTAPVASVLPTGGGLFDLSGNVWEWVEDAVETQHLCPDQTKQGRLMVGGGWDADRAAIEDLTTDPSRHRSRCPARMDNNLGFRCAVAPK